MEFDGKFWAIFWALMTITAITLILCVTVYKYNVTKLAFTQGYERTTVTGNDYPIWQKVK